MKLHPPVYNTILEALEEIFSNNRHASKTIEYYLKNRKKWGSRDRRFFAESVYDIVRWWRKLWWRIGYQEIPQEISSGQLEDIVMAWLELKDYPRPPWLKGQIIEEPAPSSDWAVNESIKTHHFFHQYYQVR